MVLHHAGPDAATGSGSGFHVGFLMDVDASGLTLLGGNQHDSVKLSHFPLVNYEVKAMRWPDEVDSDGDPVRY